MSTPALPPLPDDPIALRAGVAALLDVDPATLSDDTDLVEAGLDSIRVMALAERWSADGVQIGFMDLAEEPTLAAWWSVVADARAAS
ncbi:phosphopantetheine-binding protein [Patulibacter sp. SYSU D01012]|uniref:phosphopantetheine-binding protein n=1 Tax=Patulibacter sp. SYSU D01012 TaxID=2817381 RepID=UPI001B308D55|nr:phosphopantetheine-binding protein [Patulibacter sp. SYSU D01012]